MNTSLSQVIPAGVAPRISVVVPCRNEAEHIAKCVAGLLALEMPASGMEVIVADGMSDDGTREALARLEGEIRRQRSEVGGQKSEDGGQIKTENRKQKLRNDSSSDLFQLSTFSFQLSALAPAPCCPPSLRVIDNPGRIVSTGLNAAIHAAKGDIIVRMDAHTEYAPDYVRQCVAVLEETGADNVGGPARTKADSYMQEAVAAAYHSPFAVGGARFHNADYEGYVDTVTYGCWRKSAFEKFGYFDEELVRNQDDEHNLRIIRGGGKVYQSPKIRSWYRPRGSLGALFKQYMQYGYWKVRVIQKHKLPASWRHLVPGAFVLALLLLLLSSVLCFLTSVLWPPPSGSLSSVLCPLSSVFLGLALTAYLLAVLAASVHTVAKAGWKLLPALPFVFPCYHFGYGFGFLRGVMDFVVLRRRASASFTKLTRGSPQAAPIRPPTSDH